MFDYLHRLSLRHPLKWFALVLFLSILNACSTVWHLWWVL